MLEIRDSGTNLTIFIAASVKHSGDTSGGGHLSAPKLQKTGHSHSSDVKKTLARQRSGHDVHSNKEYKDRDYRTSNVKDRDYRDLDYRDKRMPESRHGGNHVDPAKSQDRDYRSTNSAHETRQGIGRQNSESAASHGKARTYGDKHSESNSRCEVDDTGREERSKSSSSTPLSSQDVSKAGKLLEVVSFCCRAIVRVLIIKFSCCVGSFLKYGTEWFGKCKDAER